MALKMLTNITGNLMTRLKSARNDKAVASFTLTFPGTPWARIYTQQLSHSEVKAPVKNLDLVTSLEEMGVDVTVVRKKRPALLQNTKTYEKKLKQFLTDKGADTKMVASIISRYPQVITRQYEVLDEMWNIWKAILGTDATVLSVAQRSPESFFRTSNIENFLKNIDYIQSLKVPPKVVSQLMLKSPRTFANSIDLNRQNVEYLLELCSRLGGKNPQEFVRELISRNIYILTQSTNRIQNNVDGMKSLMKLEDGAILLWIQGNGAPLLNLSYTYFENNFKGIQGALQSLGCTDSEISCYIFMHPKVLLMTPKLFESKIRVLLDCGVDVTEILNSPNILTMHSNNLKSKVEALSEYSYDFRSFGLNILLLSQTKFLSKIESLRNP